MDPENYVTSNRSSGSGDNLKPVIQKTNATAKTDVCKEVYHVPFVTRKPKGYVEYQFPERISSSESVCNILPQNLTDNPNRKISVKRQQYPAANNNVSMERAVMLANGNPSIATINNPDPWLPKKTRNVIRSESNGRSALVDYVPYPERISSENVCNILPQNLTDNPNRIISVESQHYPSTNNNVSMGRAAMLGNRNSSIATINNPDPWLPKKTRNVSRSESDGRSALAEKVWERHYLARFYADFSQIKETNSIWQDMFEIIVMFCVLDIGVMNLKATACFIKGIIWLLR